MKDCGPMIPRTVAVISLTCSNTNGPVHSSGPAVPRSRYIKKYVPSGAPRMYVGSGPLRCLLASLTYLRRK